MRHLLLLIAGVVSISAAAPDLGFVDTLVTQHLREAGVPGAAIAVVWDGRVILAKGYGVSSIETGQPVTPDTVFRIGSTTKIITAASVLTLVSEGKLDLNQPIGSYVKGLAPKVAAVTAHQLLSHTAGLGDRGSGYGAHDDSALGRMAHELTNEIAELEPGAVYSYSSLGYWLAGYLLETIGGQPFADAARDRIITPLGMERTSFRPVDAMTWPLAQQHKDGKVIRPYADDQATWPGGSLFSTTNDLGRFMVAFMAGKVPGGVASLMAKRHAPLPGSDDSAYGYGLVVASEGGVQTLSHGGARIGYGSMLVMAPERRAGVVVLANRSNAILHGVVSRVIEALVPETKANQPEPQPEPLHPAELPKYTGTYAGGPLAVTLKAQGGKLMVEYEGEIHQAKHLGRLRFSVEGPIGYFVLLPGPDGRIRYLHTNLRTLLRKGG